MKTLLKIAKAVILLAAAASAAAFICERIAEIKNKGAEFLRKPTGLYERYVKRPLDCFLSTGALIVLFPLLLCLTVIGAVKMKGNPFFTQDRPGRTDPQTGKERIFKLIKFRSMTNERDENGELLLFKSIIDGLNYMSSLGWNLEEVYVIPSGGNGSSVDGRTHWVMSKIVGEDGDPTPLRTRQQVRDEQKRLKKMKKEAKKE